MIHILKPFDTEKNLGRAYNKAMSMIPEGDWACLMDLDTMFLTPNAGTILEYYVREYPDAGILTCRTNRIHPLQKCQLWFEEPSDNDSVSYWIEEAHKFRNDATQIKQVISGFLMLIKKETWNEIKFNETGKCLGVDNDFSRKVLDSGRSIFCMEGLLVWHTYRLMNGITNKNHLL